MKPLLLSLLLALTGCATWERPISGCEASAKAHMETLNAVGTNSYMAVIRYHNENWNHAVVSIVQEDGSRLVFDPVSGRYPERSEYELKRPGVEGWPWLGRMN